MPNIFDNMRCPVCNSWEDEIEFFIEREGMTIGCSECCTVKSIEECREELREERYSEYI